MLSSHLNPLDFLNLTNPLEIAKDFVKRVKQIKTRDLLYGLGLLAIGSVGVLLGQTLLGSAVLVYSVYKFYRILYPSQNQVREFLAQAQSRLNVLREAIKTNSQSVDSLEGNCNTLNININDLTKRLTEIQNLATNGNEELEKLKKEAAQLYQQATDLFGEAEKLSQLSQASIKNADQAFKDAFDQLHLFKDLTPIREGDLEKQKARFNTLYETCATAQKEREQHSQSLIQANQLYREAFKLHAQASETDKKALIKSQEIFKEIERRSQIEQVEQQCRQVIEMMKKELSVLKEGMQEEGKMIDGLHANITQASQAAEVQIGFKSLIFGGGGGAMIGALGGGFGAGAGAVAGAVAFHNRDKVSALAIGSEPEAAPTKPTKEQPVTYAFNPKSSGLLGRVEGRASNTRGKVAVAIHEKETVELKFDLNAPDKINHKDLCYLAQRITENLGLNPGLAAYYSGVLDTLATITIDRNHDSDIPILNTIDPSHKPMTGFISFNEPLMKKLASCAAEVQKGQMELETLRSSPAA